MLATLLAVALAQPAYVRVPRPVREPVRATGRSASGGAAFFQFAPSSGSGMGVACAGTNPNGTGGAALTFTRASSAWCTNDDYSLTLLSSNQPRVMRGRGPAAPLGFYVEELAGQNDVLQNRDLSNAAWTKSGSMTCTKTATGVDSVANSASTCTSSAATQTVTQAVTRASAANATSLYIRRRTGTGTVEVTRDNGTTWNNITSSLTSDWKRVVCLDAEGCMGGRCIVVADMCATSANPTIGVRITTSTDAVDIDLAQNEARANPSSPITSVAVAGTRAAESAYLTLSSSLPVLGSISVSVLATKANAVGAPTAAWQSNTNFLLAWYAGGAGVDSAQDLGCAFRPTSGLVSVGSSTYHPGGGYAPLSCSTSSLGRQVCMSGHCATAVPDNDITGITRVYLGAAALSGQPFNGIVTDICLDGSSTRCGPANTRVAELNKHIVWLGDSITFGSVSAPTRPPYSLSVITAARSSRVVQNSGFPGDNVAAMKVRWDSYVKYQGWGSLVFLGGVNDLRTGTSASTIFATTQQILDDARARGMVVVPVYVTPWGLWPEWTAGRQTETLAYNALLQTYCNTYSLTCIDAYSALSAGGGSSQNLNAIYDSGDGLHPNAAGSALLATTVSAAFP